METASENQPDSTPSKRGQVYHALSLSFFPPDANALRLWEKGLSQYSDSIEPSGKAEIDPLDLRIEYNRLFVGPNSLPCPPYESVYRRDRRQSDIGMLMAPSSLDVKKRYEEAGLQISKSFTDLPDHIAVELEFMSYLCEKEALATGSGDDETMWAKRQQEFWNLHLKPWVVPFAECIIKNSRLPYYRVAAQLLKDWVAADEEILMDNSME
jgi:putative dimethyl sulfoxide reductase chaperone